MDSVTLTVPTAAAMREFGRRIATLLRPGDLVLLTGDLGAGKTTLTQGIGAGLKVRGQVTSPTFVIARAHRSTADGPDLVHVDAYRLGSLEEVDDLDLDASLDHSVTVVEWGEGKVEALAEDRLEITIQRARGEVYDPPAPGEAEAETVEEADSRTVTVTGVGARWGGVGLAGLRGV